MEFKSTLRSIFPLAVGLLLSVPLSAQVASFGGGNSMKTENPFVQRWKMMRPSERDSIREAARRNFPMMFRKLAQMPDPGIKLQKGANKGRAKGTSRAVEGVIRDWKAKLAGRIISRAPLKADADSITNSKLSWYGYIPSSTGLTAGFYKFALGPNPTADLIGAYDPSSDYSGGVLGFGSAIIDGKMYIMYVDSWEWNYGWVMANFKTVDLTTGKVSTGGSMFGNYLSFAGYATAQSTDGTVYGQFFNDTYDATNCVWGSRDYSTMTKIADFGPSSKIISVALGITSDGKLYSVGEDGNLYQISTTDGKENLVGATGVIPYTVNGTLAPSSGEIDPKTNTFYWAAVDQSGAAGLYTVDLSTGQATKVSDWGDLGNIEIQSLTPVIPPAEDGAPAIATNLSLDFQQGDTTGTITFTAPTTTYSGGELSDSLDFHVYCGQSTLATGKVFPGDEKTATITVPSGHQIVSVVTSNDVGNSPVAKIDQWFGFDIPYNISGQSVSLNDTTGQATVRWNAPTQVYHSGYLGKLSYNIYRRCDNKDSLIVNVDSTVYVDQLPEGPMKAYSYKIEAVNGNMTSYSKPSTGRVAWGDPFDCPWTESFRSDDNFACFKIINNNGDNSTWKRSNGYAYDDYSYQQDQDKWLMTPPVNLKASSKYLLTYSSKQNYAWYKGSKFQVCLGKGRFRTVDNIIKTIGPDTIVMDSVKEFQPHSDTIRVDEDGAYYIGFHDVSPASAMTGINVGPISLSKVVRSDTPDSIRYLTVTAASNGDDRAQIIFQAPQKDVSGNKLTANIPRIELSRNGSLIYTFYDVTPGSYLQYSDEGEDIKVGDNTYSVRCFLTDEDYSPAVATTAYVGVGIPQAVPEASVIENRDNKSLDFSWSSVSDKGANGHKVKVNEVEYGVFKDSPSYFGGYLHDKLYDATYGLKSSVSYDTETGDPEVQTWSVVAANDAGMSDDYYMSIISGKPRNLPYEEHFLGGAPNVCTLFLHTVDSKWGGAGHDDISSDGDGFSVDAFALPDTVTHQPVLSLISWPKFDISSAEHPAIVYDVNTAHGGGYGTPVAAIVKAGPDITELASQEVDAVLPDDFHRYKVSLDNFKDMKVLSFGLGGRFNSLQPKTGSWVDFDNIRVLDLRTKNIGIRTLSVPNNIKAGNTANIEVTVENLGEYTSLNYIVKAEAEGKIFYQDTVSESMPLFGQKTFALKLPTSIYEESHDIPVKVSVALDGDEIIANDTASALVPLIASPYPTPSNVAAIQSGYDINISWTKPTSDEARITEGFDNHDVYKCYDIGGINDSTSVGHIGPWTVQTVDKGVTTGPNVSFPNNLCVKSFQVINPDTLGYGADQVFPTYSGDQELVSFDSYNGSTDHWLISPELTGKKQTVSLWYRQLSNSYGNESFQLLASANSLDPDSFSLVKQVALSGLEYKQVSVELPEGTKYFAVRHISGTYGLQIDDVTYTTGSGDPIAYNLYVDGTKVKSINVDTLTPNADGAMTYTFDNGADDKTHEYAVSAVYAGGESRPVPVTLETVNSIEQIIASGEKVDVYTVDGKLVRHQTSSLSGLHGVYVIKGKTFIMR